MANFFGFLYTAVAQTLCVTCDKYNEIIFIIESKNYGNFLFINSIILIILLNLLSYLIVWIVTVEHVTTINVYFTGQTAQCD